MEMNTGFNDLVRCPLSLHKLQLYLICTIGEPAEFKYRSFETLTASSLIQHRQQFQQSYS